MGILTPVTTSTFSSSRKDRLRLVGVPPKMSVKITTLEKENARLIDQNASLFQFVDLIKMALSKLKL